MFLHVLLLLLLLLLLKEFQVTKDGESKGIHGILVPSCGQIFVSQKKSDISTTKKGKTA